MRVSPHRSPPRDPAEGRVGRSRAIKNRTEPLLNAILSSVPAQTVEEPMTLAGGGAEEGIDPSVENKPSRGGNVSA